MCHLAQSGDDNLKRSRFLASAAELGGVGAGEGSACAAFRGGARVARRAYPTQWRGDFPTICAALAVSPRLRELILRAINIAMLDGRDPIEAAVANLIIAEAHEQDVPPCNLPQPQSDALTRAVTLMWANAAETQASLHSLGQSV